MHKAAALSWFVTFLFMLMFSCLLRRLCFSVDTNVAKIQQARVDAEARVRRAAVNIGATKALSRFGTAEKALAAGAVDRIVANYRGAKTLQINFHTALSTYKDFFGSDLPAFQDDLKARIMATGISAIVLGALIMMGLWRTMYREYRRNIFKMRKGHDLGFNRPLAGASASTRYIALQAWHCGLGYVVLVWTLFIVLFLLSWIKLWIKIVNLVSEAIERYALLNCDGTFGDSTSACIGEAIAETFLSLLTFTLLMTAFEIIMLSYITTRKDVVKMRRWFSWMDLFMAFVTIASGFMKVLIRFISCFVIGLIYFVRCDQPQIPKSAVNSLLVILDSGYKSYISMLVLDHYHNNPVVACACHELSATSRFWKARAVTHSGDRNERVLTKRERRRLVIRNKWWLIITLIHNPALIDDRKHNVRARLVSKSSNWHSVLDHLVNGAIGSQGF